MIFGTILLLMQCLATMASGDGFSSEPHKHDTSSRTFLQEPLVKVTNPTGPSRKLVQYTKDEVLKREVIKVTGNVFVAIGWALANSIMIVGDDGVIIVDTTESVEAMQEILREFRKITTKPVKAIIFTHFHTDHHHGTHAVIEEGKRLYPEVAIEVYSHEMTKDIMLDRIYIYDISTTRGIRQFGTVLEGAENARTGCGIGPELRFASSDNRLLIIPTITFAEKAKYKVAGVVFELIHTPGETDDQITVWLPEHEVVLPGDNIYKTFPNLYAIRGTPKRDTQRWYRSLDVVRSLKAEHLVGSHTRPIHGRDAVSDTLLIYRDAIKFVHDQTLRLINKGLFPGEIIERLKLPDKLSSHPFLQEHYGTLEWSIKGVFTSYLGWFSGNPRDLHHMSDLDRAVRMTKLITNAQAQQGCATEILLREAERSHRNSYNQYLSTGKHNLEDDKWALELTDNVLSLNGLKPELIYSARQLKISVLRALGIEQTSPNGRNYYLTYALEMESGNASVVRTKKSRAYTINNSPTVNVLHMLCFKVKGLDCQHKNFTIELTFTDEGQQFGLTLRNGVCDVLEPMPQDIEKSVSLTMTAEMFKLIKAEDANLDEQITTGEVTVVHGSVEIYKEFLKCFDPVNSV